MRSIPALILGGVVAVLLAWLANVLIDHTTAPQWLGVVAWVVAVVLWLIWAFPKYLTAR